MAYVICDLRREWKRDIRRMARQLIRRGTSAAVIEKAAGTPAVADKSGEVIDLPAGF
jgi:hypothetical protein